MIIIIIISTGSRDLASGPGRDAGAPHGTRWAVPASKNGSEKNHKFVKSLVCEFPAPPTERGATPPTPDSDSPYMSKMSRLSEGGLRGGAGGHRRPTQLENIGCVHTREPQRLRAHAHEHARARPHPPKQSRANRWRARVRRHLSGRQ